MTYRITNYTTLEVLEWRTEDMPSKKARRGCSAALLDLIEQGYKAECEFDFDSWEWSVRKG